MEATNPQLKATGIHYVIDRGAVPGTQLAMCLECEQDICNPYIQYTSAAFSWLFTISLSPSPRQLSLTPTRWCVTVAFI